ncbi:MAG: hypothetical protein ACD_79C00349G0004 [uncultured bacterium]|nr:MAG: hypothetical protein ACD_79C00349G0004 [uncultured bacterium]
MSLSVNSLSLFQQDIFSAQFDFAKLKSNHEAIKDDSIKYFPDKNVDEYSGKNSNLALKDQEDINSHRKYKEYSNLPERRIHKQNTYEIAAKEDSKNIINKLEENFFKVLKMTGFTDNEAKIFSTEIAKSLENTSDIDQLNISISSTKQLSASQYISNENGETESSQSFSALSMNSLEISIDLTEGTVSLHNEKIDVIQIQAEELSDYENNSADYSKLEDFIKSIKEAVNNIFDSMDSFMFDSWIKLNNDSNKALNEEKTLNKETGTENIKIENKNDKNKKVDNKLNSFVKLHEINKEKDEETKHDYLRIKLDILIPLSEIKEKQPAEISEDKNETKKENKAESIDIKA